jgi:hypothetical protein
MPDTFSYAGYFVDTLAFDGATAKGEVLLQQTLCQPGEGGKMTAGIQLLAQRVYIEWFTEKGSVLYNKKRGTTFMTEARLGYFRTQLDVYGSFSRAKSDIALAMAEDETLDMKPDERYGGMEIAQLAMQPGIVKMYVSLWSKAGKDRAVLLPVTWTV